MFLGIRSHKRYALKEILCISTEPPRPSGTPPQAWRGICCRARIRYYHVITSFPNYLIFKFSNFEIALFPHRLIASFPHFQMAFSPLTSHFLLSRFGYMAE